LKIKLPVSVEQKSDVIKFSENVVLFEDGSFEEFTVVVYCTGYDFKFPFLSTDCGLSLDEKQVSPLFRHCINIHFQSMAIIGLPFFGVGIPMFDLQVRFALKFMSGKKKLPSKEIMLIETEQDQKDRKSKGFPKKKAHYLGLEKHAKYYADLAELAEIESMKPVISRIFDKTVTNLFENFNTYRFYNFKIVDDENFEEIFCKEEQK
jgi:dimethylaniline monooxygenase (N-oxide forming)